MPNKYGYVNVLNSGVQRREGEICHAFVWRASHDKIERYS